MSWGVTAESCPLHGLGADEAREQPYHAAGKTQLTVLHQMHHLRTHGEYLAPRTQWLSRDVQRAVGTVFRGLLYTAGMFLLTLFVAVAALHLLVSRIDPELNVLAPEQALPELVAKVACPCGHLCPDRARPEPATEGLCPCGHSCSDGAHSATELEGLDYLEALGKTWYRIRIAPTFEGLRESVPKEGVTIAVTVGLGFGWALVWVLIAWRLERALQTIDGKSSSPFWRWCIPDSTRAGWSRREQAELRFVRTFNVASVLLAVGWALVCARLYGGSYPGGSYLPGLALPLAFALGAAGAIFLVPSLTESRRARLERGQSRVRRSLYATLSGAAFYGLAGALLIPVLILLLFASADLPGKLYGSALALLIGSWIRKPAQVGTRWMKRIPVALVLGVVVGLFLILAAAEASQGLLDWYRSEPTLPLFATASAVLLSGLLLIFVLGLWINPNRISPHYFYRDRLAEAYLRTDGRVDREPGEKRQGRPLANLRSNEKLQLRHVGDGNHRAPYQLIVAAINLQGSGELNRKQLRSQHFLFSRDFVGSEVTGFRRTAEYREGATGLARAMTISAAAAGSAIGYQTFWAQAFLATLFNVRLGYWMENPWHQSSEKRRRFVLWPYYLLCEMFGRVDAWRELVNLSDGGHTGDNLGLLPLLERRCDVVLVVDAEADSKLQFGSFNNAVRLAFIERDIDVQIDLGPVQRSKDRGDGYSTSEASVVCGKIKYPATGGEPEKEGDLIYVKSSISVPRPAPGSGDDDASATDCSKPDEDGKALPPHIVSYLSEHPQFPHETTADQFFDDAQFEAYRRLGFELGRRAATCLDPHDSEKSSSRR